MNDVERKQLILIDFIRNLVSDEWKVKAEYSTNDNDLKVIVCQEVSGQKTVFYGECDKLFNYYSIDIFGNSIKEAKNLSLMFGSLIGTNNYIDKVFTDEDGKKYNEKWQIMFKQFSNFQPIEYSDLRRISYNSTFQCIIGKIASKEIIEEE